MKFVVTVPQKDGYRTVFMLDLQLKAETKDERDMFLEVKPELRVAMEHFIGALDSALYGTGSNQQSNLQRITLKLQEVSAEFQARGQN